MPIYSFKVSQVVRAHAELNIECENFQEALAGLASTSRAGNLQWESGVDGVNHAMVHAISKDGVPIPGVQDTGAESGGWHGACGRFELADVPLEFLAIKD